MAEAIILKRGDGFRQISNPYRPDHEMPDSKLVLVSPRLDKLPGAAAESSMAGTSPAITFAL
jgi:hypothetical protein